MAETVKLEETTKIKKEEVKKIKRDDNKHQQHT